MRKTELDVPEDNPQVSGGLQAVVLFQHAKAQGGDKGPPQGKAPHPCGGSQSACRSSSQVTENLLDIQILGLHLDLLNEDLSRGRSDAGEPWASVRAWRVQAQEPQVEVYVCHVPEAGPG